MSTGTDKPFVRRRSDACSCVTRVGTLRLPPSRPTQCLTDVFWHFIPCASSSNRRFGYRVTVESHLINLSKEQTNSVSFNPQANYTDKATASCRRILLPTLADRGASHGQSSGSPTDLNLSFLDRKDTIYGRRTLTAGMPASRIDSRCLLGIGTV
jgi:hypothetical protein